MIMSVTAVVGAFAGVAAVVAARQNMKRVEEHGSVVDSHGITEYLKLYSDQLIEKENEVEPFISEISQVSHHAIDSIVSRIDNYLCHQAPQGQVPTGQIFRQLIGHLFNAFSYEMPWQNTNHLLLSRFTPILDLQTSYKDFEPRFNRINIEDAYHKRGRLNLEMELFGAREFLELLSDFFGCINFPDQLHESILNDAEPVFLLLREHKRFFQRKKSELEKLLRRNSNAIEESPKLLNRCKLLNRKLGFLESSFIVEGWVNSDSQGYRLSQVLFLGFFLIMLERCSLWGKYVEV